MSPLKTRRHTAKVVVVGLLVILGMFLFSTSYTHKNNGLSSPTRTIKAVGLFASQPQASLKMSEMFRLSQTVSEHLHTFAGRLVIPERRVLDNYSRYQLEDLYHRYVENIQIACRSQIHFGKEYDGGYYFCEDIPITSPCMMYSFGTRNDYSFDDRIANSVGCDVHSFDPGDGQKEHQRSERVWFHKIGLGGSTREFQQKVKGGKQKWSIYDLKATRKLLDHENRTLDILKIDTEGMIWETLVDIARPGVIDDVKYLIMELHSNFPPKLRWKDYRSKEEYAENLDSLRRLYDLGFRQYYFQRWPMCTIVDDNKEKRTGCHDVHFIQTKFL